MRIFRAATSVRRVGVMRKYAVGQPRVVGGREGADCMLAHAGGAFLLVAARALAIKSGAGEVAVEYYRVKRHFASMNAQRAVCGAS